MLRGSRLINIGKKEFQRYGKDSFVSEGKYICLPTGFKPDDLFKTIYKPIAGKINGSFYWIVKASFFAMHDLLGARINQRFPENVPLNFESFENVGINLRSWQKLQIQEAYTCIKKLGTYKAGVVAPVGAGKTLTALVVSNLPRANKGKTLVLAAKFLHSTWEDEIKKFGYPGLTISTYESALKVLTEEYDCIIMDEVLKVKNPGSQVSKKITKACERVKIVLAMTGTPTSTSPQDWSWLNTMYLDFFPTNKYSFMYRFGNPQMTEAYPGGPVLPICDKDSWNYDGIVDYVAPITKAVNIEEIMEEIPEKTYRTIELPTPKEFTLTKFGHYTMGGSSSVVAQCRQCTSGFVYIHHYDDDGVKIDGTREVVRFNEDKIKAILEILESLNEPVVIFSAFQESVNFISEKLREKNYKVSTLNAETDQSFEVRKFTEGETDILVASGLLSEGMNLQERCRVAIFESNVSRPDKRTQAEGRVYRQGQKRAVQIIDIVCKGTLDLPALNLLQKHTNETQTFIEKQLFLELERLKNEKE